MSDPHGYSMEAIAARKADARRDRARLKLAAKVEIVERMRTELAAFAAIRSARQSGIPIGEKKSD